MCENVKDFISAIAKYKKLILIIVCLAAILLPIVLVVNQAMDIASKIRAYPYIGADVTRMNAISFSGEGKVFTKPDIALVTLSVVTEGKNVGDVQDRNTKKMNSVIDFLKKFGVEEKDIKTTNYNLYPRYSYEPVKIPQIIGYEISQGLEIKIRNLDKVGEILAGSVDAGVNQVYSLYFKVDKDEEFKANARALAIENAKKKAQETAAQLGVRLGKLISFNEGTEYPYPVYRGMEGIGGGGEAPNIQVGENEILVTVTLVYEIQ